MTILSNKKRQNWLTRVASKGQIPISKPTMNKKRNLLGFIAILTAVLLLPSHASETTQGPNGSTKTKILVDGLYANTFLVAGDTLGFLNVSRDEIANTTSLDFSYATPDPLDPDIVILVQAAGDIPNSALTISMTDAHLAVTTSFPVNRCVVNIRTAVYNCDPGPPITFDLTWVRNGFGSVEEKTQRTESYGPLTIRFKGEYESRTATVNGTWTGHTASDMLGNLSDSKNNTLIREITLEANR